MTFFFTFSKTSRFFVGLPVAGMQIASGQIRTTNIQLSVKRGRGDKNGQERGMEALRTGKGD